MLGAALDPSSRDPRSRIAPACPRGESVPGSLSTADISVAGLHLGESGGNGLVVVRAYVDRAVISARPVRRANAATSPWGFSLR
jgi:hypothetical protein